MQSLASVEDNEGEARMLDEDDEEVADDVSRGLNETMARVISVRDKKRESVYW